MGSFLAAADESDCRAQMRSFVYGGYVAPVSVWTDSFAPAWEEHVLETTPTIPYVHTAELLSSRGRQKFGLTELQAEDRVDAAVQVIKNTGGLHCVRTLIDGGRFRERFRSTRILKRSRQFGIYPLEPDYIGFLGFARGVLEYVSNDYPDADSVNFVVERKTRVTTNMDAFLESLVNWLIARDRRDLVRLVGTVVSGDKQHLPLQAADVAVWHIRKWESGESRRQDVRRMRSLLDGRRYTTTGLDAADIDALADRTSRPSE